MNPPFNCLLANRAVVALGGPERRTFLQGLISNDASLISTEQAIYAALLTPQGKFLHDLFIIDAGEEFLIDCEAARSDDLLKRLMAYKLRAKVVLRNAPEFEVWASEGQGAFVDPRLPEIGFRSIIKKENLRTPNPEPQTTYDRYRLALGIADGSRDMIVEKSTLAEGNFDFLNGVSWTKGCYVGQELTARMHYRALAKKRMFPVEIEGVVPAFGASITFNGEEIGDMRSASGDLGLALLNVEKVGAAISAKTPLISGESRLKPYKPEWMKL